VLVEVDTETERWFGDAAPLRTTVLCADAIDAETTEPMSTVQNLTCDMIRNSP